MKVLEILIFLALIFASSCEGGEDLPEPAPQEGSQSPATNTLVDSNSTASNSTSSSANSSGGNGLSGIVIALAVGAVIIIAAAIIIFIL
jgi:hypothetical protein